MRHGRDAPPDAAHPDERTGVTLFDERARLVANAGAGPNLFVATFEAPRLAQSVQPGQFAHMQIPGMESHILRRPFSVYGRSLASQTVDILYQVVGAGTRHLSGISPRSDLAEGFGLIGPVGRGWSPPAATSRALLVGGGVGAAPLFMLAESLKGQGVPATVVLGAQTHAALACEAAYLDLLGEDDVRCATDDGSYGRPGFCTSLATEALDQAAAEGRPFDYVAVCGPEPLMRIVAQEARERGVACEVSMERRMACGVGACLSCVVETVQGKKRSCVDGPVFDGSEVLW